MSESKSKDCFEITKQERMISNDDEERGSDSETKDVLDPSVFEVDMTGMKRGNDEAYVTRSSNKKSRNNEPQVGLPVANSSDLNLGLDPTDQFAQLVSHQENQISTSDLKDTNDYQALAGLPVLLDPLNSSTFRIPSLQGMNTFQGILNPPAASNFSSWISNPPFLWQPTSFQDFQPNVIYSPENVNDPQTGQSQMNSQADFGLRTNTEPSSQNVGTTFLLQQETKSDQADTNLSVENPSNNKPFTLGNAHSRICRLENPVQFQQLESQVTQNSVSQSSQSGSPMMQVNSIPYAQVYPNPFPPPHGSRAPDMDPSRLPSRNRMMPPQLPQVAGGGVTTPSLPPLMSTQRPVAAQPASGRPIGIPLALSCDVDQLSEYQILVRQQLEIFEATPDDVESNTQGRKKRVSLGQVGLRCRHCADFPIRQRGRGAVYYPAKLQGVYQAAQNMASSHLCESCQSIPLPLKQRLRTLRERRDTASGGKQYWADGARAMGLTESDVGLRLKRKGA